MSNAELTQPVGALDHIAGSDDAPVTLVEYGDYECPYCGMAHPVVKRAQRELGEQLRFVFRHFPLGEAHPHAQLAAQVAEAAGAQGRFWEMHDMIFEHQDALDVEDLLGYAESLGLDTEQIASDLKAGTYVKRVRDDFRSGVKSGVNGTPSFFVNGIRYDGSWANEQAFVAALRDAATSDTVEAPSGANTR